MVGRTAPIKQADRDRFQIIKYFCGCLPCLLVGHLDRHTTIEHVTERGRRVGHDLEHQSTIGLCAWHHFGHPDPGALRVRMLDEFGPSLADGRGPFEHFFGDEVEVLVPLQDYIIALFAANPWPEYNLPRNVARKSRNRWKALHCGKTFPEPPIGP